MGVPQERRADAGRRGAEGRHHYRGIDRERHGGSFFEEWDNDDSRFWKHFYGYQDHPDNRDDIEDDAAFRASLTEEEHALMLAAGRRFAIFPTINPDIDGTDVCNEWEKKKYVDLMLGDAERGKRTPATCNFHGVSLTPIASFQTFFRLFFPLLLKFAESTLNA